MDGLTKIIINLSFANFSFVLDWNLVFCRRNKDHGQLQTKSSESNLLSSVLTLVDRDNVSEWRTQLVSSTQFCLCNCMHTSL